MNRASRRDLPPRHITADSREVMPGSIFIAVRGRTTDGHQYVQAAIDRGAVAVIHETDGLHTSHYVTHPEVRFLPVPDTRALSHLLAAPFYDFPSRRMRVTCITGTNGKTTCGMLLEAIHRGRGHSVGLISSLGIRYPGVSLQLANIVPEPVRLQTLLFDMDRCGVDTLVLEASSQALADGRLDGIDLDAVILTNITRDHLDVHGSMRGYLEAKLTTLELLARSSKPRTVVSVWRDTALYPYISRRIAELDLESTIHFVGQDEEPGSLPNGRSTRDSAPGLTGGSPGSPLCRRLRVDNIRVRWEGTSFVLHWEGRALACWTRLLGEFNVLNIMAAVGSDPELLTAACSGAGWEGRLLAEALADIRVPGRLQPVPNSLGARIFIDYAHTEDGLEKVLRTLRCLPHRRLYTLFGCGGDRDRGKRPRMGAVAGRLSDLVWLTSDNPRTESPAAIIEDIVRGFGRAGNYLIVEDREEAIATALGRLVEGDILLIAGKGHENSQVIGTEERPFSDAEVTEAYLRAKGWRR